MHTRICTVYIWIHVLICTNTHTHLHVHPTYVILLMQLQTFIRYAWFHGPTSNPKSSLRSRRAWIMHACVYGCVCMYCIFACMYANAIHMCVNVCIKLPFNLQRFYVCVCMHAYVCMYIHMCSWTFTYVLMYVYTHCACMCICMGSAFRTLRACGSPCAWLLRLVPLRNRGMKTCMYENIFDVYKGRDSHSLDSYKAVHTHMYTRIYMNKVRGVQTCMMREIQTYNTYIYT
jgi:hypothetical protein